MDAELAESQSSERRIGCGLGGWARKQVVVFIVNFPLELFAHLPRIVSANHIGEI